MASSSKVQFHLDTLRQKALESIDERIRNTRDRLAGIQDKEALLRAREGWRRQQEAKVSALMRSLEEITDYDLSKFKIDPIPDISDYEHREAQRLLDSLLARRSKIVAKMDSLVADAQGNISLTKTQLEEFFAL